MMKSDDDAVGHVAVRHVAIGYVFAIGHVAVEENLLRGCSGMLI
jgi:hypothetical protein